MRIVSAEIENYRCLEAVKIQLGALTSLIGMNGVGKSAVLRSIAAFYEAGDGIRREDWYGNLIDRNLTVTLTFADLSPEEREEFGRYVSRTGELRVARIWRVEGDRIQDSMHGFHMACPDFQEVREAERQVAALHNALVASGRFPGLQRVSRQDQVEDALIQWETANADRCEWILDSGKFFGWKQVGGAKLATRATAVYVPAVREARDESGESRSSALGQIVELALREELGHSPDLEELRRHTQERFTQILEGTRPSLRNLAQDLSSIMSELTPGSQVSLDWRSTTPTLPEWPPIEARLVEEGIESPVWAKGHGLQRSFIVSLLHRLADWRSRRRPDREEEPRHTVLLIEEPELYQHPLAVRRFATVLRRLVEGHAPTQVVYSTHHAGFVAFDHFDSIRRLQKREFRPGSPPATEVRTLTLKAVADRLVEVWGLDPNVVDEVTTRQRLRTVLSPQVSEGFFARAVILVEGQQDQAVLEGFAAARGLDLAAAGIAVLPVGGKWNLDRAFIVFTGFGIPTYMIWDADVSDTAHRDSHARVNRVLQQIAGMTPEDSPATQIADAAAVFADKLEAELNLALGDAYDQIAHDCSEAVGLPAERELLKTAYGCGEFAARVSSEGHSVKVIDDILDRVIRPNDNYGSPLARS